MLSTVWPSVTRDAVQNLVLLLENLKFAVERLTTVRVSGSYRVTHGNLTSLK
jgi:hypothetical protein